MAWTKDRWTSPKRDASGNLVFDQKGNQVRAKNDRWGKGKRWLAVWLDANGDEKSLSFRTKAEADEYGSTQEVDVSRGNYVDPSAGRTLLKDVGERWLGSRSVDPSSAIKYGTAYRLHVEPAFGKRQIKGIKPSEVAEWLTGLDDRFGYSTARTALLVVQGVLDLAVEDELVRKNVAKSKAVPRPAMDSGEEIVAWPDARVTSIIDSHPDVYRPIPVIAAGCGLRAGELYGLALEDFDLDEGLLHIRRQVKKLGEHFVYALPKNDHTRVVPLPEWVASTVRAYVKAHPPRPYSLPWEKPSGRLVTAKLLFRWTDDKHVRARSYDEQIWKPVLSRVGVIPPPVKGKRGRLRYETDRTTGIHQLRHYYASAALGGGVNIKELSVYLGHHDPSYTLQLYAHLETTSYERARKAIDGRMLRLRAVADGPGTDQG